MIPLSNGQFFLCQCNNSSLNRHHLLVLATRTINLFSTVNSCWFTSDHNWPRDSFAIIISLPVSANSLLTCSLAGGSDRVLFSSPIFLHRVPRAMRQLPVFIIHSNRCFTERIIQYSTFHHIHIIQETTVTFTKKSFSRQNQYRELLLSYRLVLLDANFFVKKPSITLQDVNIHRKTHAHKMFL